MEVGVAGDQHEAVLRRVPPDPLVVGALQPRVADVRRAGEAVPQRGDEAEGEVLVEQQPPGPADQVRRSRSAAKARQARRSSRSSSGKSARISSSDMPAAR